MCLLLVRCGSIQISSAFLRRALKPPRPTEDFQLVIGSYRTIPACVFFVAPLTITGDYSYVLVQKSLFVPGLPVLHSLDELLADEAPRIAIIPRKTVIAGTQHRRRTGMATKLYVGNLSYQTDDTELREQFAQFGTVVSANVVTDRDTGRSRGFGFVEMTTEEEARAAETGMNGRELDGRSLKVNESRPREDRSSGGRW
jgi:hypothetical protein